MYLLANPSELRNWLGTRSSRVALAVGSRAVLRALPYLGTHHSINPAYVLAVFRAAAISVVAAKKYNISKYSYVFSRISEDLINFTDSMGEVFSDHDDPSSAIPYVAISAASAAEAASYIARKQGQEAAHSAADAALTAADVADANGGLGEDGFIVLREDNVILESIATDIIALDNLSKASMLLGIQLWLKRRNDQSLVIDFSSYGAPERVSTLWLQLKTQLLNRREDWDVWIEWYERLLTGRRGFGNEIEMFRVTLNTEDDWKRPPAEINAMIKAKIREVEDRRRRKKEPEPSAESPAPPPPAKLKQRPATIEPVVLEGRIVLPDGAAQSDLNHAALLGSMAALKQDLVEIADEATQTQADPRIARFLRGLAARIGESVPAQHDLFALGHAIETLETFATSVHAEWPDILAARYAGMVRGFDRTLRQFPEWRAFLVNARRDTLTAEQIALAPELAREVAMAIRDADVADIVDTAIPDNLDRLADEQLSRTSGQTFDAIAQIDETLDSIAYDLLESINNVLKLMAEFALRSRAAAMKFAEPYWSQYRQSADKSLIRAAQDLGDKTGPFVVRVIVHVVNASLGGTIGSTFLSGQFGWMAPAIAALGASVVGGKAIRHIKGAKK